LEEGRGDLQHGKHKEIERKKTYHGLPLGKREKEGQKPRSSEEKMVAWEQQLKVPD